ncbi:MAG: ABC transporter permease, partial [Pseudonocardiaceae bacterium]
ILNVTSTLLTIPSLALFALLIPFVGIGTSAPLVALFLYALLPIVRNTVSGLRSVDPAIVQSARGMGVGALGRLLRIELPLAWPVIISGIRVAMLITISIAVVAALINGPGLGKPLQSGLARLGAVNSFNEVITGTLGCLVVAAGFEVIFRRGQALHHPEGDPCLRPCNPGPSPPAGPVSAR